MLLRRVLSCVIPQTGAVLCRRLNLINLCVSTMAPPEWGTDEYETYLDKQKKRRAKARKLVLQKKFLKIAPKQMKNLIAENRRLKHELEISDRALKKALIKHPKADCTKHLRPKSGRQTRTQRETK